MAAPPPAPPATGDAPPPPADRLAAARTAYTDAADMVRSLRATSPCDAAELSAAEARLRALRVELSAAQGEADAADGTAAAAAAASEATFSRTGVASLLRRRFFYSPAFDIYGGVSGLYDYGPPACAVKNNVVALWRQHFVLEEGMLELEGTCLTPEPVLKTSGHVDKFSDLLVEDAVTGAPYRADHLLEEHLVATIEGGQLTPERAEAAASLRARLDELDEAAMAAALAEWKVKAPETDNALTAPYAFNLMFKTQIGPKAGVVGYLRPETAQGIFVNFKRLLDYNGGRMPFAAAQIGLSFRNEISPRAGVLRVREFLQAEIEHFVHPQHKGHPKFAGVAARVVNLFPREQQLTTRVAVPMSVGDAVAAGTIDNETLGYFIARTDIFAEKMGLNLEHVRFRQHLEHEMAHYASDCWDLEVNTSYRWIECAGIADRSCFDLTSHSVAAKTELTVREVFDKPQTDEVWVAAPNKGALGKAFKRDAQKIMAALAAADQETLAAYAAAHAAGEPVTVTVDDGLASGAPSAAVDPAMLSFKRVTQTIHGRNYYPSVVEPSFGIGRLLYCLWEHAYFVRSAGDGGAAAEGSETNAPPAAVLRLPPEVAPVKVILLPLMRQPVFSGRLAEAADAFRAAGLSARLDDSGQSIGRRYARADEVGTPFGVTVDHQTVEDGSITVRDRDTTAQVRCPSIAAAVEVVRRCCAGLGTWADVSAEYPSVAAAAESDAPAA